MPIARGSIPPENRHSRAHTAFVTLMEPRGILRAPKTPRAKVACAALLLPLTGLLNVVVQLAGVHAKSGEWAWSQSATPPKVHFNGVEYLRIRHPTFPDLPPEDVVVGKTPGGGVIFAAPADPSSQLIYVHDDAHYAVYVRPGGG